LVAVLLALAACGSGGGTAVSAGDGRRAMLAAPTATVAAGSAHLYVRTEAGNGVVLESSGALDITGSRAWVETELPGGSRMDVLQDGATVYVRLPAEARDAGIHTPWVSLDQARAGEALTGLREAAPADGSSVADALAMLGGVSEHGVRRVGREDVRGVRTTRYAADVDLRRAAEASSTIVDREAFDRFVEQLGTTSAHVEAWLDDDGLVRRFSTRMPAANGIQVRTTMELYDFGKVDVRPPPDPKDVTDITDEAIRQAESRQ
jgi:hypothetical protein